jgi:hydrogenase nickel incorporation protein HypA/HybF
MKQFAKAQLDKSFKELSNKKSIMVPKYIEACYPAAVDGTILQGAKLEMEMLPANAICKKCDQVFNILEDNLKCPKCESRVFDILGGKEFIIKEIVAC